MESSLLASIMINGVVDMYVEKQLERVRGRMNFDGKDVSEMQKVGNC